MEQQFTRKVQQDRLVIINFFLWSDVEEKSVIKAFVCIACLIDWINWKFFFRLRQLLRNENWKLIDWEKSWKVKKHFFHLLFCNGYAKEFPKNSASHLVQLQHAFLISLSKRCKLKLKCNWKGNVGEMWNENYEFRIVNQVVQCIYESAASHND